MEWQDKIAIADYGTMAVLFLLGLIAAIRAGRTEGLEPDSYRLCYGIALICLWGVLHQSWWFTRWVLLSFGDPRTQFFLDNSWALMVPYTMAFVGSISVAFSLFRRRCFLQNSIKEFYLPWFHGWSIWAVLIASVWMAIYIALP